MGFSRALGGGDLVPDDALNGDKIVTVAYNSFNSQFTFAIDNTLAPVDYFYKIAIISSTNVEVVSWYSQAGAYGDGLWQFISLLEIPLLPNETYTFEIYYDKI